jgi:hypothetical protein
MVAIDRLITAVGNGVPATAARRAGHPDTMWTITVSMHGKVVLTNRKVSKDAKVWISYLTKHLRKNGDLGPKSSVNSNTIEIYVGNKWMPLDSVPVRTPKPTMTKLKALLKKGDRMQRLRDLLTGMGE